MRTIIWLRRAALAAGLVVAVAVAGLGIEAPGAAPPDAAAPAAPAAGTDAAAGVTPADGVTPGDGRAAGEVGRADVPVPALAPGERPNIVFVLTDDLTWSLVPFLSQVRRMQRTGITFTDYTVADSLCCPARASILTGRFPHSTGVYTNSAPDGGFRVFRDRGEERRTFATALRGQGYRTALMGKYLNEYPTRSGYVPPGWDRWLGSDDGYPGFRYTLSDDGRPRRFGAEPEDYLTDVLAVEAEAFVTDSAAAGAPFLLEVSTFAPHWPYTPAPRDTGAFPGLTAPRTAAFDRLPANPPPWLAGRPSLTRQEAAGIDANFRLRAQSVRAVDDLIATLRSALDAAGVADRTYLVFASDNGYHMGEYRMTDGKQTAFDADVVVPLVVTGPGVPAGVASGAVTQNVDLAPTFTELGGARVAPEVDGRSLVPLLRGDDPGDWRTAALVEHRRPAANVRDPDAQVLRSGDPPSYGAVRTGRATYVQYADGQVEYYDRAADPAQLDNAAARLTPGEHAAWQATLRALRTCRGGNACQAAGRAAALSPAGGPASPAGGPTTPGDPGTAAAQAPDTAPGAASGAAGAAAAGGADPVRAGERTRSRPAGR